MALRHFHRVSVNNSGLSSEEFYFLDGCNYYTLDGVEISQDEFESFLEDRRMLYYNLTLNLLADLELNTISQLNNLIYIENSDFEESSLGESYKGQGEGDMDMEG